MSNFEILGFQERLTENLPSVQIANTLDDLLMRAMQPLLFATDYFERTLVEMLPFVASNARRRFVYLEQQDFVDVLFSLIASTNKDEKFAVISKLKMERTVYFDCLRSFERLGQQYTTLLQRYMTTPKKDTAERWRAWSALTAIEKNVGLLPGHSFLGVYRQVFFWHQQATLFKGMVAEKFIRLAFVDSGKAVSETALHIDRKDIFHNFMLSTARAIDKYDASRGALTSYIRMWFMDAKTAKGNSHEYNTSFSVPTPMRKKLLAEGRMVGNLSVQMDEDAENAPTNQPTLIDSLIEAQELDRVSNIAVRADPFGLASLIHDIPYHLTDDDKKLLADTVALRPPDDLVKKVRKGKKVKSRHGGKKRQHVIHNRKD